MIRYIVVDQYDAVHPVKHLVDGDGKAVPDREGAVAAVILIDGTEFTLMSDGTGLSFVKTVH